MWIYIFFINFLVILITHFIICDRFKYALILSNIWGLIFTYIYLFYIDGFIDTNIFIQILIILSSLNFILSYWVGFKMNWFTSKKFQKYTPINEYEYLNKIINIDGYDIKKNKQ